MDTGFILVVKAPGVACKIHQPSRKWVCPFVRTANERRLNGTAFGKETADFVLVKGVHMTPWRVSLAAVIARGSIQARVLAVRDADHHRMAGHARDFQACLLQQRHM